ncbi:MAG: hypothetical protein AB7N76_16155 [Planctomycetota bacterium]
MPRVTLCAGCGVMSRKERGARCAACQAAPAPPGRPRAVALPRPASSARPDLAPAPGPAPTGLEQPSIVPFLRALRQQRFVARLGRVSQLLPQDITARGGVRRGEDGCLLELGAVWLGFVACLHLVVRGVLALLLRRFPPALDLALAIAAYGLLAAPAWGMILAWWSAPWLRIDARWVRWRDVLGRRGRLPTADLQAVTVTLEREPRWGEEELEHLRVELSGRTGDALLAAPDASWLDPLVRLVPPARRCLPTADEL